jgi:SPP1 gp7 family putative phage head morphogenesis protein
MKYLPGQEVKESDYAKLLEAIDKLIWEAVYKPVVDLVRPSLPKSLSAKIAPRELTTSTARELHNAPEDALKKALREGAVQMVPAPKGDGVVFVVAKPDRRVSDSLRAFGAALDKRTGNWTCARSKVPAWVRLEAQGYADKARAVHEATKKLIDDLSKKLDAIIEKSDLAKAADHAISEVTGAWKESAKSLEVKPDLGPEGQQALAAAFERSRGIQIKSPGTKVGMVDALDQVTKREVKVWAQEALARLRSQVDENAEQGYRAEGLAERIRNEYGVSKSRADLIARQETSNFMAAHTAARAADAGLKRYQWYCVRDANTRKDHLKLHGKIFRFDTPPITDSRTGARNNPGGDFRCRCVARPVLE